MKWRQSMAALAPRKARVSHYLFGKILVKARKEWASRNMLLRSVLVETYAILHKVQMASQADLLSFRL